MLQDKELQNPELFHINESRSFAVNGQFYQAMVVPGCSSICDGAAEKLEQMAVAGVPVLFVERKPAFISETGKRLPSTLDACPVVPLPGLVDALRTVGIAVPVISPANKRIRLLEIQGDTPVTMIVNEGTFPWTGTVSLSFATEECFLYDAWENRCLPVEKTETGVHLTVKPLKPLFLVCGSCKTSLRTLPEPKR